MKLKKLQNQVIVITGASSGIGMLAALHAGARGARVVLAARSEEALNSVAEKIRGHGSEALVVPTDVTRQEQVQRLADRAIEQFGGFDTWINNAGISIYGREESVSLEDERRLFDVTYWGVVYGCRVAIRHLREHGGALINVGSVASDRALPLQASYSAAKHAVKGYTDTLRMELEHDQAPVSLTLIKPGFIDTAFVRHSKNYLPVKPKYGVPVYAPELVADAILHAAEHPVRDLVVGGGGKLAALAGKLMPRATDKTMEYTLFEGQQSDKPDTEPDSLYTPEHAAESRSGYHRPREHSLYTEMTKHRRLTTAALLLGTGALATTLLMRSRRRQNAALALTQGQGGIMSGGIFGRRGMTGGMMDRIMGKRGKGPGKWMGRADGQMRHAMENTLGLSRKQMRKAMKQSRGRMQGMFGSSRGRMEDMLGEMGSKGADIRHRLSQSAEPAMHMTRARTRGVMQRFMGH